MENFQFFKAIKIVVVSLLVILTSAGCNKAQPTQQTPSNQQATSTGQTSPAGQMQARQDAGPPANEAGKPDYTPGYVVVTNTVEGSNLNHRYDKVKAGTTAYDLLANTHQVVAKDYGAAGKFVQTIDGIAPDNKHFWTFYVNGKPSNVGASSYVLKDSDKVEWKLDLITDSGQ